MLQRCSKPSRADWPRYGGRGITVCDRWRRFDNFLRDMGPCPADLVLERIDNNGNYEPGNCCWSTWQQQYANRRPNGGEAHPNAKLDIDEVLEIRELATECGLTHRHLAAIYRVSHANIGYIARGQAWRGLPAAIEGLEC
jgi:hypothetical protein